MSIIILTGDGKYETTNNNGRLTVLRHGKVWDRNLVGDGYVLSLVQRIEELEERLLSAFDIPEGYTMVCPECGNLIHGSVRRDDEYDSKVHSSS